MAETTRTSTRRQSGNTGDIAATLAAIPSLSRQELIEHWVSAYDRSPPRGISRRLLEYAAAYYVQVRSLGGLKPAMQQKLRRIAEPDARTEDQPTKTKTPRALSPGTRLVREWHGRSHTVDVEKDGFLYEGQRYGSLSEIARAITGARWSGPRFFGL